MKKFMKQYGLKSFPLVRYTKLGNVAILKVLGLPVFKRVGRMISIFGIVVGRNAT